MTNQKTNAFFAHHLLKALRQFNIRSEKFLVKPNFTQVCSGTTDCLSLEELFKTLAEQSTQPEIRLVEIPNVNAPSLRQVINELKIVETIKKYEVKIVYLDEQNLSEYGEFSSLRIPNLFLQRHDERLIVIAPPKEHQFLPGGIDISNLTPHLKGYSGVMKNLAVGVLHKDDKRMSHGVIKAISEKYETKNLRLLWSMMTEEEKTIVKEKHNSIIHRIINRLVKPEDVFILTKIGMLGGHLNGTSVKMNHWIIGNDPKMVDELGVQSLIEIKKSLKQSG